MGFVGPCCDALNASLVSWTRWNAATLLIALGLSVVIGRAWPVAAAGLASLGMLCGNARGAWTSTGSFGWANTVTAFRAVLVWATAMRLHSASAMLLAAVVLALFALDGLDGWLARRRGSASEFGALFDMETDAFFVLTIGLVLFQRGDLGPWILAPGILRYLYVLTRALIPARNPDVPRSRFGRLAFTALSLGLFFGFALPGALGTAAALFGTLLVSASFARSFHDSYATRA